MVRQYTQDEAVRKPPSYILVLLQSAKKGYVVVDRSDDDRPKLLRSG